MVFLKKENLIRQYPECLVNTGFIDYFFDYLFDYHRHEIGHKNMIFDKIR